MAASAAAKEGAKVAFTYNQGFLQNTSLCILKGAPNLATAVSFLNEAMTPHSGQFPQHIDYGPANPKPSRPARLAGKGRANAEFTRQCGKAGADVIRLVGRGRARRGKALGRLHAEMLLPVTRRRHLCAPRDRRITMSSPVQDLWYSTTS